MEQYLFKFRTLVLVLIITFVNCAFVSVTTKEVSADSSSTTSLIDPAKARFRVKKVSFVNRFIHKLGLKLKRANTGLIALVVVLTVLVSLLLAAGIFIFAWGGASGTLLAVVGIVGLALIIFGAARIIRGIKRRQ